SWAVGSLVVRASDSRPEGLGSMPPTTLRVHTEYGLVKSVGPKSCGLSHERRDRIIFPSPSVPCRNCGGGDRSTSGVLLAPCNDEFRGPRSDYVRQMALETTITKGEQGGVRVAVSQSASAHNIALQKLGLRSSYWPSKLGARGSCSSNWNRHQ
ncbi:uncharacterized protein TNCV_257581, partial [Trichonephila clavipes]